MGFIGACMAMQGSAEVPAAADFSCPWHTRTNAPRTRLIAHHRSLPQLPCWAAPVPLRVLPVPSPGPAVISPRTSSTCTCPSTARRVTTSEHRLLTCAKCGAQSKGQPIMMLAGLREVSLLLFTWAPFASIPTTPCTRTGIILRRTSTKYNKTNPRLSSLPLHQHQRPTNTTHNFPFQQASIIWMCALCTLRPCGLLRCVCAVLGWVVATYCRGSWPQIIGALFCAAL